MTDVSEIAQFKRISIPLIRRVYPQLIADKICAIQPMCAGSLSWLADYKYSQNSGWQIKPKKKKIWRSINDPWEPSVLVEPFGIATL